MAEPSIPERSSDPTALVIGAAGLDMIGRLNDIPQSTGAQAEKSIPANIRVSFGGVARNVAENLARLGYPVCLITAVGPDQWGQELVAQASACGIDVSPCLISEHHPTSSYLAVLNPDGANYLALENMTVLEELTPAYIREKKAWIEKAGIVFIDANLPPASIKKVIQYAKKGRIPVCADTTTGLLAGRLAPYLDSLYMLTANSREASVLCQNDPAVTDQSTALQAARSLVNRGVELVVISLAEFGVVYATSETSGHIPAVHTRILDPTGAGDALTATLIFGLLNDIPVDESVRLGVAAASLILRHRGTVYPGLSLERLYDELLT